MTATVKQVSDDTGLMVVRVARKKLKGLWFHSVLEGDILRWQGKIIEANGDFTYQVQLYSWFDGGETDIKTIKYSDMKEWVFYLNHEDWRANGDSSLNINNLECWEEEGSTPYIEFVRGW